MINTQLFDGKYKIKGMLGQGGMSKVYLAENIKLGSLWAIKEISKKSDLKLDFLAEPNILKKLEHPALPRIFDILEDNENIYFIVDYIDGISLDKKLESEGRFAESVVLEWAEQICNVLDYLHSFKPNPIIYRDMKPSNIMLTRNGAIKLIDFGIAREYKVKSQNDTVYIGTRGYAAPEQYGSGQTGVTSDIYSFGITIYQLLTGKSPIEAPYEIKPIRYYDSSLSNELEGMICKCTRQNPSERYQSIKEILEEIEVIKKRNAYAAESNSETRHNTNDKAIPFKKLVLTVWDNAEFGCELAYMAAKFSNYSVMLIDIDLLAPKADLYLGLKKYPERIISEGTYFNSGLNIAIDSVEKNFLTSELMAEASIKRNELRNLFVLTGNYNIENYEYYNDNSVLRLIEKSYLSFDITILLVNKSIYDSYTVAALAKSDYNLVALKPEIDKLREFNSYIKFLKDKQQISMDKTKFIAFEYDNSTCLDLNELIEATLNNVIGKVGYSKKRAVYRNLKTPYVRRIEKNIESEYIKILSFFNIIPVYSLFIRFKYFLANIHSTCRSALRPRKI